MSLKKFPFIPLSPCCFQARSWIFFTLEGSLFLPTSFCFPQEAKEEASEASGVVGSSTQAVKRSSRREKIEKDATEPVRKSLRLAGGKVPEIKRFTFEQFEFLDEQLKSRKIKPEDFYLDDELVSRNIAVEEREKMLEEMAAK